MQKTQNQTVNGTHKDIALKASNDVAPNVVDFDLAAMLSAREETRLTQTPTNVLYDTVTLWLNRPGVQAANTN